MTTPRPALEKDLSHVSKHYDIGSKGFLTPAEQKARDLDHNNQGVLSNEQVVGLIQRTEDLKKANQTLRRWMMGLLLVTVTLGCSQIATAIVAARLSKETSVNSSSGLMTVKGSGDTPVVVVSKGTTTVINVVENGDTEVQEACVALQDLGNLLTGTAQGTKTNAVLRSEDSLVSVAFESAATNETHACLEANDGSEICTDFEPCGDEEESGNNGRRTLEERSQQRELNRRWTHRHLERALYLDESQLLNDFLDLDDNADGGGDYGARQDRRGPTQQVAVQQIPKPVKKFFD